VSFTDEIADLYAEHGPRHLLPFIGAGYEDAASPTFRVAIVGLNSYISDGDWPEEDDELRDWYHGWWSEAGHGKAPRFYNAAYREADSLARVLAAESGLFDGLAYDGDPRTKAELYGTNAIKVFLGERFKKSDALTPDDFRAHAPTWHRELDAMAKHAVPPSLIVVYGSQAWTVMWKALWPGHAVFEHMRVARYETCGSEKDLSYHHANRVTVELDDARNHTLLLVRLSHPSGRSSRRAAWLLDQEPFRQLAGL